jgi:hypothetical protein
MRMLRYAVVGTMLVAGASGTLSVGQKGGQAPARPTPAPTSGTVYNSPSGRAPGATAGMPPMMGLDYPTVDANGPRIDDMQLKARNYERQRKIQAETDRLVSLAADLKQQVDKPDKTPSSADLMRRAEEIEKLAKSVKERMKG